MAFHIERKSNVTLTPKKAAALLEKNTYAGQRPLREEHVRLLAEEISARRMVIGHIALGRIDSHSEQMLFNGQHTCRAVIEADAPLECVLHEYVCDSAQDLALLFATFDTQRVRSERNVMHAARIYFKDEGMKEVPEHCLCMCGTALMYLGDGVKPDFSAKTPRRSYKSELVQRYARDVFFVRSHWEFSRILNTSVATAMIATHRKNKLRAETFWKCVLSGERLERGSPEKKLNEAIHEMRVIGPVGGMSRLIHRYSICAAWWNTYVSGKARQFVRPVRNGSVPELLGPS